MKMILRIVGGGLAGAICAAALGLIWALTAANIGSQRKYLDAEIIGYALVLIVPFALFVGSVIGLIVGGANFNPLIGAVIGTIIGAVAWALVEGFIFWFFTKRVDYAYFLTPTGLLRTAFSILPFTVTGFSVALLSDLVFGKEGAE